ncbi:MAG: DUF1840 domain-containing protein [Candidatus Competibacteraceae bacterium]|uniref:DUF1840 domain-containing protein n=1 Tax=Candidatus Contendobacter odensis Run_B_J11 TaxID=1400861 RepID=A0A7U7GBB4_9GAMM|nr:DUF1840 domain-containing protein [Candidatus Contendobacter odensis]MBK8535467.1 DUF1840 domain-containing protein [Candidatus Competibacteraceae bacterium]MBK8752641.1 DUF1840 domain-containing protein [Candidatus Competibacteraceae bacterium]CDH45186.1 conserved hypothetical protein [Candidatus Contendobacter odensis Run_B_J11]
MIVTFRTKAHADIMIFGDIAITLLKLMGHSGTVPSALLADEVPAALERLRTAVAAHKAMVPKAAEDVEDNDDADESSVDLAQRAFPLIELLAAAATAKCDVMWDQ